MNPTREPFLEEANPLMVFDAGSDMVDVTKASSDVGKDTTVALVPIEVPVVKPQGRRFMLRLPKSVYDRFMATSRVERRQFHVVLEKAIEEFLDQRECEPRPYIPQELKTEALVDTQSRIDADLYMMLEVRSLIEERSKNALGLRAVLNYLDSHEGAVE